MELVIPYFWYEYQQAFNLCDLLAWMYKGEQWRIKETYLGREVSLKKSGVRGNSS